MRAHTSSSWGGGGSVSERRARIHLRHRTVRKSSHLVVAVEEFILEDAEQVVESAANMSCFGNRSARPSKKHIGKELNSILSASSFFEPGF